mgnify:CR=1 FL=1
MAWKLIDINREALKGSTQEVQLLLASSVTRELDIHVRALQTQVARVARALGPAAVGRFRSVRAILSDVADERMVYPLL